MKRFKTFIESKEETIMDAVLKFTESMPNLPKPTGLLDTGGSAFVYNTTNPDVLVRVGPDERECESQLQRLQKTGGVVKIFHMIDMPIGSNHFIVTWKEKISEFVEGYLRKTYGKEIFEEIGSILSAMYMGISADRVRRLSKFPPTAGLAKAIKNGLPIHDLSLESNLGVTKDGKIVAFDC